MADLALVVLMAVWGSTFAIVRVLVGSGSSPVSPILLVAVRMAVAFALLLVFLALRGGIRPSRDLLRDGLVCAVFLGAGFLLQIEGQHRTTASRSGFLTGLLVVFVPLIELVFFKKRPAAPQIAGVLIAVSGMAVLSGGGAAGNAQLVGDLLTFGCAVVFAIHIVILGRAVGCDLPDPVQVSAIRSPLDAAPCSSRSDACPALPVNPDRLWDSACVGHRFRRAACPMLAGGLAA